MVNTEEGVGARVADIMFWTKWSGHFKIAIILEKREQGRPVERERETN